MTKNINIELPEKLHKELKVKAIETNKTLKELVIELLSK
ncbi:MAG: toxin-antitoxin system HicB family antitoxin [Candidatus Nanoarchaeia archaeon]